MQGLKRHGYKGGIQMSKNFTYPSRDMELSTCATAQVDEHGILISTAERVRPGT